MIIRKLNIRDLPGALRLVWEVFVEFEAPDYSQEGVDYFRAFIMPDSMERMLDAGVLRFYGAFDGDRLIGVIAMRGPDHISLLFVDKAYHRRGIGRTLFAEAQKEMADKNSTRITVNSSPYAIAFYTKLGFVPLEGETVENGIRFTPMLFEMDGSAPDD